MEKNTDAIGKKEFRDVWTRVSGGGAVAEPVVDSAAKNSLSTVQTSATQAVIESECEKLLTIMNATAQTSRECLALLSQSSGGFRRICRSMRRACNSSISDLNAQYNMMTGLRSCPGSVFAQAASVSDRLSAIIETEGSVCQMCGEAADETAIASLQSAYTRAAVIAEYLERTAGQLLYNLNRS